MAGFDKRYRPAVVGLHLQEEVWGFEQAIQRQAPGTVNKFFQVQAAARAKQLRPDTYTVVRHHMDEQTQLAYLGMADKRAAADGIFRRFIDGTFAQHAEFVDAVEFTNEMWGPNRRDEVEALDIAGIRVWTEVYQAQQIFEHIRCVFGNAAVGNNTTTAVAREVAEKGQILGYHPYIPVKLGVPLPREISHYSLRWMALDDMYKQNDIYVDWFFGEIGAVGYCSSSSGGDDGNGRVGRFEPGWGWQHPDVCNGDLANYLKILDSWAAYVMAWNHKNDNRALGGTIFSSGPGWPYFQIRQPVMNQVADHYKQFFANIPEPKPEPEPEPEEKAFGIDVSHWQGEMDWARAKAQGVQFAFIKATEGTGHTDSQFFRNWTEVGKQGILRAPYHFYLSRMDPITQADYAASRYPSNAELPLVVDIEDNKEVPADIANRVLVFLKKVEELTGRRPIIYTAAWWWNPNMGSPEWAAGYHLWAAVWTGNPNPSPASLPSGFAGWKFWQYTSQGDGQRYGAQSATLDLNRFNGDAKALQEYADGYVIPEPEPVEAYWKIGWHAGVGGNRNNIGQYMSRLDAAGIPFCVKSVNDGGLVEEAAGIARSSGVKHSIIFRLTNPGGAPHDKPDFNKTPEAAAVQHWSLVRNNLPPEVVKYKDIIWIEPTNEIDTHTKAAWLGWFMYHLAVKAVAEGFKVALSGFNAGQPEREHWHLEGMVRFLTLCSLKPEQVAVSMHQGKTSGDKNDPIEDYFPHMIGRFLWLYEECDKLDLNHPTTFDSEWAWVYNDMPEPGQAMEELRWYAELIAKYPSHRGVFLWNLAAGEQWRNLPNLLNRLMGPVTEATLVERFHVEPDPDPDPEPEPEETFEQKLNRLGEENIVVHFNSSAALQKRAFGDNYVPMSEEFKVEHKGVTYLAQSFYSILGQPERVYFCVFGDWGNVQWRSLTPVQ